MENINEITLLARSRTRTELALMYLPGRATSTARKKFNEWLKINKALQAELLQIGADERTRLFTPKQVELIFKHLGYP